MKPEYSESPPSRFPLPASSLDLSLVATTALLDELYGRYDAAVFAGLRNLGGREEADYGYSGSTYTGEALARELADYLHVQRALLPLTDGDDADADE